jgi:hypothetical protein
MSVRVMLCLSIIENLHSRSIDFVLAYPQADLDIDMFMELPLGSDLPPGFDRRDYVLKLHKNLCGLKQAGHNRHVKLKGGLLDLGFKPCMTDPCVFTKDIWSMKRKRIPGTGVIQKHKARLCAHGGQQVYGVNYWETYAPVVQWMSVRVMLCLSIIENLHSRSIDFVLAYPQADLDIDMFMELPLGSDLPPGFDRRDYVLKLHKNLYGLKQAGHNWHVKLKGGLLDLGFKPCMTDPCVFTKDDLVVLVFVDDCLVFSRHKQKVDDFITQLRKKNFILTDEGDIRQHLGIDVTHHRNGTIELRQPFLIETLIKDFEEDVGVLNSCREPATPKQSMTSEGDARKWSFSYPSYIGRLNFLSGSTRPDIAYATHRCARFSKDPRQCHENALKKIVRYLKKTADKGMIITPDRTKGLECYVDASFCEGWTPEVTDDPTNCYSRTGYVILLFTDRV